jgi:signal transduction histidine kinase
VALSAALGAAVAVEAEPTGAVAAGAAGAVLLLSLALVTGRSAPIPFALLLLGSVYAIPAGERAIPAPVYGAGLLLCAELAYWSLELRVVQRVHGDVVTPRLLAVLGVAAASVPAGALVLLAAEAGLDRSPATTAAAALAVVACVALLVVLARPREAQAS